MMTSAMLRNSTLPHKEGLDPHRGSWDCSPPSVCCHCGMTCWRLVPSLCQLLKSWLLSLARLSNLKINCRVKYILWLRFLRVIIIFLLCALTSKTSDSDAWRSNSLLHYWQATLTSPPAHAPPTTGQQVPRLLHPHGAPPGRSHCPSSVPLHLLPGLWPYPSPVFIGTPTVAIFWNAASVTLLLGTFHCLKVLSLSHKHFMFPLVFTIFLCLCTCYFPSTHAPFTLEDFSQMCLPRAKLILCASHTLWNMPLRQGPWV